MNVVCLVGRLAKDPEMKGTACRFTLAVDKELTKDKKAEFESQGKQTADFISCVAFGKTGEVIRTYLTKGRQLAITGRIQTGSYTAEDGSRRYTTDVVVVGFDFIGNIRDAAATGGRFTDDAWETSAEDTPF